MHATEKSQEPARDALRALRKQMLDHDEQQQYALQDWQEQHRNALELLEDRLRERLKKYKQRIVALERQVETLERQAETLEEQVETLESAHAKRKRRRTVVYESCSSDAP